MRTQLLMTGSELMRGTTIDTNAVRIADALASIGLAVHRKVTIGDDLDLLVQELRAMSQSSDVLIVNGGLGPTSDDLTAQALAEAAGNPLIENTIALTHLEQWCNRTKIPLNAANKKQALLPTSAFILDNPIGSAVGFGIHLNNCLVLCTPGVPRELEAMLSDSILPVLQRDFPDCEQQIILRLHMFGIGESQAQDMIDAAIPHWPDGVVLGFRAGLPTVEIKLLARASAADLTKNSIAHEYFAKLKILFSDYIVAVGEQNMAAALLDTLAAQGKTLACAESCTGGLISAMLTEVPGSSRAFTAGFVTYSNAMKNAMLGVNEQTLEKYGAVSEQTVREMVAGALTRSGSNYAVAVSGIAGPDGGSSDKPVGTVWIGWGNAQHIETQRFLISGPRKRFQQLVAAIALDQIRRLAVNITSEPPYFRRWQLKD